MNFSKRSIVPAVALAAGLALSGCVTSPGYGRGGYYPQGSGGYRHCRHCGVVQEVRRVYVEDDNSGGGTLGAVIGAVAGGLLGNTIGKGDGRKAATVVGAVAGGVVGNQVGQRSGGGRDVWRIVVRLDDGRYATVTQREDPRVRRGDYVQVRDGHVYPM